MKRAHKSFHGSVGAEIKRHWRGRSAPGTNANYTKGVECPPPVGYFDSPVIYGVRVETSNPYHLLYIETILNFHAWDAYKITAFSAKVNCLSCKNWTEKERGFWRMCTKSLFWKIFRKALRANRFRFLKCFYPKTIPCSSIFTILASDSTRTPFSRSRSPPP